MQVTCVQVPSEVVKPPRVGESAVHMECRMVQHWNMQNPQVTQQLVSAYCLPFRRVDVDACCTGWAASLQDLAAWLHRC